MKYLFSVALIMASIFSNVANAAFIDCGLQELQQVMIQADRDDGNAHANSLVIKLKDNSCNGRSYLYLKNNHPAYSGMVSIALAAKANNQSLRVYVNSSRVLGSATQISILLNE
ncbi:hypothetical protein VINI7043_11511 [Vibrio nigripulchritudo ATCC 27043]|uniref:hypothetical protein n=1 Tax=Vibrio nigripulchritudo TaxID=28173 RepID=UPI00021C1C8D|nr:hypothetical protein [Vibrio nigripulchritudo]EGU50942.1 hypothetical protein VINI7043_11511 [Vibrio nigripulchritudo ATCC 27043]